MCCAEATVARDTKTPFHRRLQGRLDLWVGMGTGFIAGLVWLLVAGASALVASGIACGVSLMVAAGWFASDIFRRFRALEDGHAVLRAELPTHLAEYEAAIERLHAQGNAVVERLERVERRLIRPDLRELTDLATEQGWEWWRGSDVVQFVAPNGIELTFELPVEDGEQRMEIASQLAAFGLRWSSPPTRIEATTNMAPTSSSRRRRAGASQDAAATRPPSADRSHR
jgi:hypothetical protein